MASPSTTICPDLTGSRPKRARTNSDLPLPMSPPIPTISPPRPRLRQPRHAACCERVVDFDIWHQLHHRLHFFTKIVVRTRPTFVSERRSSHPIRSVLTRSRRVSRLAPCGSTSTLIWRRIFRTAAPSSRASARNSPRKVSPNSRNSRLSMDQAQVPDAIGVAAISPRPSFAARARGHGRCSTPSVISRTPLVKPRSSAIS